MPTKKVNRETATERNGLLDGRGEEDEEIGRSHGTVWGSWDVWSQNAAD